MKGCNIERSKSSMKVALPVRCIAYRHPDALLCVLLFHHKYSKLAEISVEVLLQDLLAPWNSYRQKSPAKMQ